MSSILCSKAHVSAFLWLCSQRWLGCASTATTDLTRYVLSATPAPLLGPGSASNPEAMFATICRQIHKQIRLITEDVLIGSLTCPDFSPLGTPIFTFEHRQWKDFPPGTADNIRQTHPSFAAKSDTCPYPGLGSGHPM